jgi:hypothetical protein
LEAHTESVRQHVITRVEHTRMVASLTIVRSYLRSSHRKKTSEEETVRDLGKLDFLEHVLEFSSTWNGVETKEFFPESSKILSYLEVAGMLRLGGFFARPFSEVSKELRILGFEYPLLLKKLYEAYYLRTLKKSASGVSH